MDGDALADDVETVLLQYVDLHGVPRGAYVPASRWETARERGEGFAALVVAVQERHGERAVLGDLSVSPESEGVQAVPDPASLSATPWSDRPGAVVQCGLEQGGGSWPLCSRTTLATVLEDVADLGFEARAGFEVEFTAVEGEPPAVDGRGDGAAEDGDAEDVDAAALAAAATTAPRPYDVRPLAAGDGYVSDLLDALGTATAGAKAFHTEAAPGQLEASLSPAPPLGAADDVVVARQAARTVGKAHDHDVTFMPFPTDDYEGNGLHVHLSLVDGDGGNALGDPEDDVGLSEVGYGFVAGLLEHADALAAVCAPTVNSYKRFQPGTFAPVDRSYGYDNRTAMVRIPPVGDYRLEVRLPDSYANPYLALAAILAAGADGVRESRRPPDPGDRDRYGAGDGGLPGSLGEALAALEGDEVLVDALGAELVAAFCELKRDELARFQGSVTDWETTEYVDKL
jgi:glutamine synthetase